MRWPLITLFQCIFSIGGHSVTKNLKCKTESHTSMFLTDKTIEPPRGKTNNVVSKQVRTYECMGFFGIA